MAAPETEPTDGDEEAAVLRLLQGAAGPPEAAEVVATHAATVVLNGDEALKIKRRVAYDYLDFTAPDTRRAMLLRELELNRPAAPAIYRDVVPVTREEDGTLALDGAGTPVDWVLRMWRFPAEAELAAVAARGALDDALADALGQEIARYHAAAPERAAEGAALIGDILDELDRVFAGLHDRLPPDAIAAAMAALRAAHARAAPLLDARGRAGRVRRAHGDLHVANVVVLDGGPVLFDALEFDETLGTCDVLYDLAFLLVDLEKRGLRRAANRVLNAWLAATGAEDGTGLAALPLFLGVRAAIRAMTEAERAAAEDEAGGGEGPAYLALARRVLAPPPPRLVAVGGLSGTGKSTLARALAPGIGPVPGAVLLGADATRKALFGHAPDEPLPDAAYTAEVNAEVQARLRARAAPCLAAGHGVLLDTTHLHAVDREAAARLAHCLGVAFRGLWLDAPVETLVARVAARRGDVSDADAAVVRAQAAHAGRPEGWTIVDAAGDPAATEAAARAALGEVG